MSHAPIPHRVAVPARTALFLALAVAASACATTGATFRSGVGDTELEHPPYYAGAPRTEVARTAPSVAHLPIAFQRGAAQAAIFDPQGGAETPIGRLLAEMNAYLDSLSTANGASVPLATAQRAALVQRLTGTTPPDVQFGCPTEGDLPGGDCVERGDSALGRAGQRMRLAVGRPSPEWAAAVREGARDAGASHTLVISLEVGQYLPRQVGWRGDKVVELGTDHVARLPWLTSLETPVLVLQLTGALVDSTGRAVRIGAEGITGVRSRLLVSALGAQELLRDEHVEEARTRRRDDLPGQPLAWRVALRQLVTQLSGRDIGS